MNNYIVGIVTMVRQWLIGIILFAAAVSVTACGQRVAVEHPENYIEDSNEY